ncbi:hypothetical protein [uncultured Prevotella sp.]|uniref:hypothetical protein n=1 Tax=uncultured Prevotella sp. TaxID=159272 RepID=UPI00258640B2|nr:hypothetical protein [uncultured Prevotella sp.]
MFNFILVSSLVINDNIDAISQIRNNTFDTAVNTKFGIIAAITFALSIATFIIAFLTYISQKATEKNTARMTKNGQKWIILDISRQLYKSLVNLFAIRNLMELYKFQLYPSEIHIESMKVDIDDLKQSFILDLNDYNAYNVFAIFHHFKQFNNSLNILKGHLRDKGLDNKEKIISLQSLMDETFHLINDTAELIYYIDLKQENSLLLKRAAKTDNEKDYNKIIIDTIVNEAKFLQKYGRVIGTNFEQPINETGFLELFKQYFTLSKVDIESIQKLFFDNVKMAMGKDDYGAPRIHMIKLN